MIRRKILKIFVACFLTLSTLLSCIACDEKESAISPQKDFVGIEKDDSHLVFANGKTDYQIVVADNATDKEKLAAQELEYFFNLSTSHHLQIVNESALTSEYYFSVGQTELLELNQISYNDDILDDSGYKIVTKDYNVYFIGSTNGYGSVYAVYDYLKEMVGYEYYASDEYNVQRLTTVPFYKANIEAIPTIQRRAYSSYYVSYDSDNATRLRYNGIGNRLFVTVHTEPVIMPYEKYKEHAKWYTGGGAHLCYSQEDMKVEYVKNLKRLIEDNPVADFVDLGLGDINSFCECSECKATISIYKTKSAVLVLFYNDVVSQINEWLEVNYPEREVRFGMLAYQQVVTAPATKQEDGTFAPNAPELNFVKNLGVHIADSSVDYSKPLDEGANKARLQLIQEWASLGGPVYIYTYSLNFYHSFVNFPDYLAFGENHKIWAENNVYYIGQEGANTKRLPQLEKLRVYLRSESMWDANCNLTEKVKDFMNAYYKEASLAMYEYYTALATWQTYLPEIEPGTYGYLYYGYEAKHWPKYIVDGFNNCLKKAYLAIEPLKATDPNKYEMLFDRIKSEEISVMYIYLWAWPSYFTKAEKLDMIKDMEYYCTKFGYTQNAAQGTATIFETLAAWKEGL